MSAESERRSGNRATVEKAFGLLSQQRHKEVAELITDDIDFELPYGPGQKPLAVRGSKPWMALNDATWPAFARFSLAITNVYELADGPEPASAADQYPKEFLVDWVRGWRR